MQQSNSRQPYKLTATASSVACANRDTHGVYTCVPRSAHARVAKTLLQRASKVGARAMTHASNRLQAHPNAWPFESGWATDATSVQPGCTAAPARRPHASATTRPSDRPPANDTQPTGSERHAARDASDSDARDRPEQRAISWWRPSEPTTGVTAASDRRPSRAAEGNCGRLWADAQHATGFQTAASLPKRKRVHRPSLRGAPASIDDAKRRSREIEAEMRAKSVVVVPGGGFIYMSSHS